MLTRKQLECYCTSDCGVVVVVLSTHYSGPSVRFSDMFVYIYGLLELLPVIMFVFIQLFALFTSFTMCQSRVTAFLFRKSVGVLVRVCTPKTGGHTCVASFYDEKSRFFVVVFFA